MLFDRHRVAALRNAFAVLAGGLLLMWPALRNGYPLLFSDTGTFLEQLLLPYMIWDKPWIYGPVLVLVSLKWTLWLPVVAQCLCVSAVLWLVQRVFRTPSPIWHLGLCALLAFGSAAPWFASLLMPDILTPLTVLALFLLAFAPDQRWRWTVTLLASFAIAAHLSHLVVAAACLATILVLRPGALLRAVTPLVAAVMLLMATNLVGHGQFGVSPYGAVFGLARLVADGPATAYLEESCPDAGYQICRWTGSLPTDSDEFLWNPSGPVWTFPGGPIALAPEATRIVLATILSRPWAVVSAAFSNWHAQLLMLQLDEVTGANGLDATVGVQLRSHYPTTEQHRFAVSMQRADGLRVVSVPLQRLQVVLLAVGTVASLALMIWAWRRDPLLFALISLIIAGVLSNAFATGALAGPHDRYQARIAWLMLLPPIMHAMRRFAGRGAITATQRQCRNQVAHRARNDTAPRVATG